MDRTNILDADRKVRVGNCIVQPPVPVVRGAEAVVVSNRMILLLPITRAGLIWNGWAEVRWRNREGGVVGGKIKIFCSVPGRKTDGVSRAFKTNRSGPCLSIRIEDATPRTTDNHIERKG